ncbi:class I SAM-dependent methyltransferase [Cryomorpha ignava]|uniref:Class I SAM-dependent methyltransferase n=1 Tax=Cryomorpha ignava TaxID=101383 RepID=A0A7K3WS05_9FLAO|nr:class I SAM-dependent methyltransferase [Cryomorpha ignava]NEN24264.1 class I SAM-dependent methyltransferase [Cryomorpha ignava]
MNNLPSDFWNERYADAEYAYGIAPNDFFKAQLDAIKPGDILLPAEGEGRNALHAAKQGWNVTAFDSSSGGRKKAIQLSLDHGVAMHYEVADVLEFKTNKKFDVLGFIYAHFPIEIRKAANQRLIELLKPGGIVIFEAFAKTQLGNPSGGPKSLEMLFSIEEIEAEFSGIQFILMEEKFIQLNEGQFHQGKADVIRFVGIKE